MTDKSKLTAATITPEHLMAYADGALSTEEMVETALLIEAHPELQAELDVYLESSQAISGTFDGVLAEPVPEHMKALVMGTAIEESTAPAPESKVVSLSEHRAERNRRLATPAWLQGLAACAAIAFGVFIGTNVQSAPSGSDPHALVYAGIIDPQSSLGQALETAPSATVVSMDNGAFKAIQSFQVADNTLCREYEAGKADEGVTAVACRRDGRWRVEALVANAAPAGETGSTYLPASGLDTAALEEVLTSLGALPGLNAEEEHCLLEAGWSLDACGKESEVRE